MAHGAPDYWPYVTTGLPVALPEQIEWVNQDARAIAGGANFSLVDYVVLPGEELYVMSGYVSTDFPRVQRYAITVDLVAWGTYYFDTFAHLPLNPSAMIRVLAGEHLRIRVYNDAVAAHNFGAAAYGFRITIVPGIPAPAGLGLLVRGAGV